MPIYEYFCESCKKKYSFLVRNIAAHKTPSCPKCGGSDMKRLVSRVHSLKSEESRMSALADPSTLGGLDENDPKSLARLMKKMGKEMGEEMPPELNEYCSRLEAGEDPEKLEEELGGKMGGEDGGDDSLYEG
jgi:putative FmdB family regulatory protein